MSVDKAEIGDAVASIGAITSDTVALIAVPTEEWEMVKSQVGEIWAAMNGMREGMVQMLDNPMAAQMARTFGVDLSALTEKKN